MRTFLLGICVLFASSAMAQRECASSSYIEQQRLLDPTFTTRQSEVEAFISRQEPVARAASTMRTTGGNVSVIRIPVVVHVLYKTESHNISDAQIKSQIDALNRDFRRDNADSVNTPARFKSLAADVQIEFYLATADPSGRSTTGIIRKQTNIANWQMDDKIKFSAQGGDNAWDSRYYLNFWVSNLVGLLGYASSPGGPADKDGVVINYTVFGTINTPGAFNMGRTAVHEVGHWLGLKHIWGDTYCGDDLVDDTPKQGNFTNGCPNGFRSSCSNGTDGDMYMNYMDYTNDACLNLFTNGQKQRMLSLFNSGGPRNSLLSSKGLLDPWTINVPVEEVPVTTVAALKYYPNPATTEIVVRFDDATWIGKTICILNMNGSIAARIQVTTKEQRINVAQLKPGMYFIQGENGTLKVREKLVKL